ncbi:related to Zn(II)2Cys6 transcriptional activator [Cephalotrichum gorgonifer]|uniref:Related to Zn(II)2Cys6 transcriptional activator n=1 Tax=Cephalotrichum gorgonifer TaxID=2041049 RepID=A0AAE8SUF5_9PEZI|nr:related to Zn(II)2Cys6 transcriptional activator [Cephalotrichum gorgonifer]
MPHLLAAIRYLGSFYVQSAPTSLLAEEAIHQLSAPLCPRDGFTVQANLLMVIGLDGSSELKRASAFLTQAEEIALEIGMNQREFASLNGEGLPVLEESWRRTWWELFVVDGMIAGMHQQSSFWLNQVSSTVLLPCDEHEYMTGNIPRPRSLEEFNDSDFSGDDVVFSSFTYRISAIINLSRILNLPKVGFPDDPAIARTDAYLVNWTLHLPPTRRLVLEEGKADEMLFQAQMITNASTILLHKQHSRLDTSVARSINSCAPHEGVAGGPTDNIHAAKVIQAAKNISELIALPLPLLKHTHFFTCVITLASIVDLSCWAALLPPSQDEALKQRIRLYTGAQKAMAAVWPSAQKVQKQVKDVAQEVFSSRRLAAEEGFWNRFTEDDMMSSLAEDEIIINGFQLT